MTLPDWLIEARRHLKTHYPTDGVAESCLWVLHSIGFELPEETSMSDFVTKDSGERQEFATGMLRDAGKKDLRPDLLPKDMLVRWAELMGRGAAKYSARNWEKAETKEELDRFLEGAFRHFVQWFYGLDTEEDHAAAVYFNIAGAEHVKAKLAKATKPVLVEKTGLFKVGDSVRIYETAPYKRGQTGVIVDRFECADGHIKWQVHFVAIGSYMWFRECHLKLLP